MLVLLAGLVMPSIGTAGTGAADRVDTTERVGGRDLQELQSYRLVRDRFAARMKELDADTRAYIDTREAEERRKLSQGYDTLIDSLDELELSKRDQAIEVFEQFLQSYPDSDYSAHVRFRLADLYYERQKDRWLDASEAYGKAENACFEGDGAACENLGEMPRIDLGPAIDLYERIVADNRDRPIDEAYEHLDGALYMLGFAYGDVNTAQKDDERSRQAFVDLIQLRPDSSLADAAHLFLGNAYFDKNRNADAIAEYKLVYDKGPSGEYFIEAMYQLAWSYYKIAFDPWEYNAAMDMFTLVLEDSEHQLLERGQPSDYRGDAVKYMAISFSDIAEKGGLMESPPPGWTGTWPKPGTKGGGEGSALDVARAYFAKGDPKPYEWDIYAQLGENLVQLAMYDEAIRVYEFLQTDERWKNNPENPDFQTKIVQLWNSGAFPDLEAAGNARIELTNRYNESSEWWEANRQNPEALAKARGYIESSLAGVAVEYRIAADKSQDKEAYMAAAEKFREYLDKFPISDDYYKQQWYLADTLREAKEYEQAAAEFELLIKSRRNHVYGDGAVFQLMRARRALLDAKFGKLEGAPEGAEVERTYARKDGKIDEATGEPAVVTVYKLSTEHLQFIDSAKRVLTWKFSPPAEGENDYGDAVEKNRAALLYIIAQTYFYHNRFDEARPLLEKVYHDYRMTDEGSYAASLLVDTYTVEGDLEGVRKWTKRFIADPPGVPGSDLPPFNDALEWAEFNICLQMVKDENREGAAECYMQFLADHRDSENAPLALFNAANSYQLIGKADRAIELFEQFVNTYPADDRSKQLYFRIAMTYESTFNLKRAIYYYEQLVQRDPTNIDAAAAWYNAAFLRIGVSDFAGAARAFEEYRTRFPQEGDVEKVYYLAGEQWEQVNATKAKDFYSRYLSLFWLQNPDHAFEAKYKLAQLYKAERNTRKFDSYMDEILADYRTVAERDPSKLGFWARHYAAESEYRAVEAALAKLVSDKLPKDEQQAVTFLMETKPAEIREFKELAQRLYVYKDFEYTSAAIYSAGAAELYFADLGFSLRPPETMSMEEQDVFMEILQTQVYPQFYTVQDKAKEDLTKVIDSAREKGEHNVYVEKAQAALNQMDPRNYPALKVELRGGTDSSYYPEVLPLRMSDPLATDTTAPPSEPAGAPDGPTPWGGE